MSKSIKFQPPPTELLKRFFVFCLEIEEHPFFKTHKDGANISGDFAFPESGEDTVTLSFDDIHLESFLTRLRQFYFERELFTVERIEDAVSAVFGNNPEFSEAVKSIRKESLKPFREEALQFYKKNGESLIDGRSFLELIEVRLYTGAIHSERLVNSKPNSHTDGMADVHLATRKHLSLSLAKPSLKMAEQIFMVRFWILSLSRATGVPHPFAELEVFDLRCQDEGK